MRIKISVAIVVVTCIFSICLTEVAMAQPFFGGNNGWLGLLRNDTVMDEIELVDDQREEIEALEDEMRQEMRERMMELRDMDGGDRREMFAELREEMEERQTELQGEVEKVLMPMQLKRLKELEVQQTARRNGKGAMGVLANDDILDEIGVSDKQKEKLKEKAEELKKKIAERVKKMTEEAEEELLSILSSKQRTMLKEKMGEAFEFGEEFDRRGGRGGRGGGRGGGRDRGDRGDRGRRGGREDF